MKRKLFLLFLAIQIILPGGVSAQILDDPIVQDLNRVAAQLPPDSLNRLAAENLRNDRNVQAKILLDSARSKLQAEPYTDSLLLKGQVLCNLGVANQRLGDDAGGISALKQALTIYLELKDDSLLGQTHLNLGLVYKRIEAFESALEALNDARKILEPHFSNKDLASTFDAMGNIYKSLENFPFAENFMVKALEIRKKIGYKEGVAKSYHNLGQLYLDQNQLILADSLFIQSLQIKRTLGKSKLLASTLSQLGALRQKQGSLKESLEFLQEAIVLRKSSGDLKGEASATTNFAYLELELNLVDSASIHFRHALDISKKIGDWSVRAEATEGLVLLERLNGNTLKALAHQDALMAIRDTLLGIGRQEAIARLQTEFDVERKDQEIVRQGLELELKNTENQQLFGTLVGISLLVLIIGAFFWTNWRNGKRIAKKNVELEERNSEIEMLHRELGHRSKNNLEMLSGMLHTQLEHAESEEKKGALKDAMQRVDILTILQAHLTIDQREGTTVNLSRYISELLDNLLLVYKLDRNKVDLTDQIDRMELTYSFALEVGLIVNELVTNAFKHGWVSNRPFSLGIEVREPAESSDFDLLISVRNSNTEPSHEIQKGTGLKLVEEIANRWDGTTSHLAEHGEFKSDVHLTSGKQKGTA